MPDTINKQSLINLLIDSPLREPIKINLIDIVNNTSEPDLPKVYPTIVKELEIFQKATERRMKLADETIAKLGGTAPTGDPTTPPVTAAAPATPTPLTPPPLDLPPLPQPSSEAQTPNVAQQSEVGQTTASSPSTPPMSAEPLSVPPLDLPPLPTMPTTQQPSSETQTPNVAAGAAGQLPSPEPLGGPVATTSSDEAALAEIQKELESLKAGVAADANPAPAPAQA